MISENYHHTAFSLFTYAESVGPPAADNGVINGMNVFNCTGSTDTNCKGTGKRWSSSVKKGLKYRLRFINTSVDTMYKIQIDNHTMTVIQNDFVPIQPFETTELFIAIGQRYDIILDANQVLGNYWLRAIAQNSCSNNNSPDNIRAIIRYAGQSAASMVATPTLTTSNYTDSCEDVNVASLVPIVPISPSTGGRELELPIGITFNTASNVYKWTLNSTAIVVD